MAPTIYSYVPRSVSWVESGGTTMLVFQGPNTNPDLTPVIYCHAFPGTQTATQVLDGNLGLGLYTLTATGRTLIVPYFGANWGHPTTSYPSGGTGLGAIDDALDVAVAMGHPDRAHLIGVSMGGLNALTWALANQANFGAARLFVPVVDYQFMYDQAGYQTSLAQVWSMGGRAAFVAATASVDPISNAADWAPIADKITVLAATDDTAVGFTGVEGFCERSGVELTATTGGHLGWILTDAYDEFDMLRLFDANE